MKRKQEKASAGALCSERPRRPAGVGLAGGVALGTDGKGVVGAADAQTKARRRRRRPRGPPSCSKAEVQARRTRRILRLLLERPVRRAAHRRPAVDARTDARSRVQPLQRHRLGPDQRKPQDADRGAAAGDPRVPQGPRRHLHERRPAPSAHPSFTDGTYDGRYALHERQGQHPRRAHASRRHEVRQDHPAAEPAHRARPARAEISAHRLRVLQRRGRRADPERRQGARRSQAVSLDLHARSTATP